jgi:hypothetical protein
VFLTVLLAIVAGRAAAQVPASQPSKGRAATSYKARLSPVPMDLAMAATIAGIGSATATLDGTTLTVNGTFDGLKSPATVARLHKGQRGVRGSAIADLAVVKSVRGTISGTIILTPQQAQDLQNGRLYLQIHSEKAPDGNLWGWLLPQDARR